MKFGFFMMPLHTPNENPSLAFERDIDMINYAEKLGYDEYYIGEHHSAAWETMPMPELVLAKASATATRMRLGTGVVSLPFHHPFHVAERFAFLDHLTRGRIVLGVGPSGLPTDPQRFGIPAQDLNPMMRESTDMIVKLLESRDPITYEGKYWTIRDMSLQLRSYQQPRLKLATPSVGSMRSLDFVAQYEMILMSLAGGGPPDAVPLARQWDEVVIASARHDTNADKEDWRVVTYCHLADTREEAFDQARTGALRDVHTYFYTINTHRGWVVRPDQRPEDLTFEEIVESKRWIIGTPDDAIEQIQALVEETSGFGGLILTTHEWMPMSRIKYSQELFARYVMPHFRGHASDLQREWERTRSDRAAGRIPNLYSNAPAPSLDEVQSNLYTRR